MDRDSSSGLPTLSITCGKMKTSFTWNKAIVCLINEKGERCRIENYLGIALFDVAYSNYWHASFAIDCLRTKTRRLVNIKGFQGRRRHCKPNLFIKNNPAELLGMKSRFAYTDIWIFPNRMIHTILVGMGPLGPAPTNPTFGRYRQPIQFTPTNIVWDLN